MSKITKATQVFVSVRDALLSSHETIRAYRNSWSKPLKFYYDHTKEEAIKILLEETGEYIAE